MIFEGQQSVIEAIKEKKRLMDAGEAHDHIRPLLIQGGGLMRGIYGVGAAIALEELGYTQAFSTMVGISSGAPTIAHFAAGSAKQGARVAIEECASREFVNVWRFWNQVNTRHFIDVMRTDPEKGINVAKVFDNPATVGFGVARYADATPKVMYPKSDEELFLMMHASINMQNVSSHKVFIDGVQYADGGFTRPHILGEVVESVDATHVLIVTNNDRIFTPISKLERFLNRTLYRVRLNGAIVQATNARRAERDAALEAIRKGDIPAAIVWGDGSIGGMERRAKKIAAVMESSRIWWHGLFAE